MADADESDEPQEVPATALQVARRSLVLAAVCCRGILEMDREDPGAAEFWGRVRPWFAELHLENELEPHEAALLRAPFGSADQRGVVNASWRAESLVVLAWALGRAEIPAHDRQVDAADVSNRLGFLEPETVLTSASLRARSELDAYAAVAFSVHWRLRDFSLRPSSMDFVSFSRTAWFGPLSLDGVTTLEEDLAIAGKPIAKAPASDVRLCSSIALERHLAINWILDCSSPFSQTDTST